MGSKSRARLNKKARDRKRSGYARKPKKKAVAPDSPATPEIIRRNPPRRRRDQIDDLINETDSENADDEPRAKMSESKKFPDQLMEKEDGEVVDLPADFSDDEIGSAPDDSEQQKQMLNGSDDDIRSPIDGRVIVRGMKKQKEDMDMLSSDDEEDEEVHEPEATDELVERLRKENDELKQLLEMETERSEKRRIKLLKYYNLHLEQKKKDKERAKRAKEASEDDEPRFEQKRRERSSSEESDCEC